MASTIIERVIGGVTQRNLAVNLSGFARMLTLPTGWTRARVGLRFHMTNDGASITGSPYLYIGLGAGTTNIIGDATTDHFVGIRYGAATWSFSATWYSFNAVNSIVSFKKVGVTETVGPGWGALSYTSNQAAAGTAARGVIWADITKGSPNYSIRVFYKDGGPANEVPQRIFYEMIYNANPLITDHQLTAAAALAVDESTDGTLNAVQCYWNKNDANIESAEIAVAVLD